MQHFDYAAPRTIEEAVKLLAEAGEGGRVLAGGTDLLVQLRTGRRKATQVVDVKAIPELNEMSLDPKDGLTLGAAVPCYRIYLDEAVARAYPGLIDSAAMIGGAQIQGRASLGRSGFLPVARAGTTMRWRDVRFTGVACIDFGVKERLR